jgi:hypothetical protein
MLSRIKPILRFDTHLFKISRNRSTIDHIFSIRQILEKNWKYNDEVCQPFIDFKKAYDSMKMESFYDFLIQFDVPKKLD